MTSGPPTIPDYELLRPIGRGAYGEVWLARSVTGIYRAAKIVYRHTFDDPRPFEREFEGIQRYEPLSRSQENLIDVLHVGRNDEAGHFHYIMELADDAGTETPFTGVRRAEEIAAYRPNTLKEVLARRQRIPPAECVPIAIGLCNALHHLHEHRLIHRDVKPSNIILIGGSPKLADLGLLSAVDATRSFVGTEGYVPPDGPGTPAADLYSLGRVLYEMSSGRARRDFPLLPQDFESMPDRAALLELNEIIVRACATQASERYADAEEMRTELLLLQAGKSVRRLHAAERRLQRLVPLLTGVALLAGALMLAQHLQARGARERARTAQEFRVRAEAQELATRQLLYAADMNLVNQAMTAGDLGRARELLEAHVPSTNQTDLRGFEWRYFRQLSEGQQLRVLHRHSNLVNSVAFSPDGTRLASASYDGSVRVWRIPEGILEYAITNQAQPGPVVFTPDGSRLVFNLLASRWEVRDATTGALLLQRQGNFIDLALAPRDGLLAAVEEPSPNAQGADAPDFGVVSIWNVRTGEQLFSLPLGVDNPVFSPDARRLTVGDETGRLTVFDADTGVKLKEIVAQDGANWCVAYAPDGLRLATASTDQTIRTFDAASLEPSHVFRGHQGEVWSVAFSPNGQYLASGSKDGTVRLWNASPNANAEVLTRQVAFWKWPVLSPSGAAIAIAEDLLVRIHRTSDGSLLCTLPLAGRPIGFLAGDDELLTLSDSGDLLFWTDFNGTVHPTRSQPTPLTNVIAHALLGTNLLATGDRSGRICLWQLNRATLQTTWPAHPSAITSLAISPDGRRLASASVDDTCRLWDPYTGTLVKTLSGHKGGAFHAAFAPDGKTLAVGTGDKRVRLWNVPTFRDMGTIGVEPVSVFFTAIVPGEPTLATVSFDFARTNCSLRLVRPSSP